jgi:hypothetical protein
MVEQSSGGCEVGSSCAHTQRRFAHADGELRSVPGGHCEVQAKCSGGYRGGTPLSVSRFEDHPCRQEIARSQPS